MVPELRFLPEHTGDGVGQFASLLPGRQPQDSHLASTGIEYTSQHLNRGRLARAVWTNKGEHLSWFKREGDIPYSLTCTIAWCYERAQATAYTGGPFAALKCFA